MCAAAKSSAFTVNSEKTAEVAFEDAVKEKPEKKFLNHRRDRYRENDDHDSLLDRARAAEKLDDVLACSNRFRKGAV